MKVSLSTSDKGNIGVAKATAELIAMGAEVNTPLDASSVYDLLAVYKKNYIKVQVKYASLVSGSLRVRIARKTSTDHNKAIPKGDVDLYAVYCPDTDECFGFWLEELRYEQTTHIYLRVTAAKNNQKLKTNTAVPLKNVKLDEQKTLKRGI